MRRLLKDLFSNTSTVSQEIADYGENKKWSNKQWQEVCMILSQEIDVLKDKVKKLESQVNKYE